MQNETPQNQDIDPAVTTRPEDLFGPEPDPNVTTHPEDLFGPEPAEKPTTIPEYDLDAPLDRPPDMSGETTTIPEWNLGRPSEPVTIDLAVPSAEDAWDTVSGWF
jgi:hypothetical protein